MKMNRQELWDELHSRGILQAPREYGNRILVDADVFMALDVAMTPTRLEKWIQLFREWKRQRSS